MDRPRIRCGCPLDRSSAEQHARDALATELAKNRMASARRERLVRPPFRSRRGRCCRSCCCHWPFSSLQRKRRRFGVAQGRRCSTSGIGLCWCDPSWRQSRIVVVLHKAVIFRPVMINVLFERVDIAVKVKGDKRIEALVDVILRISFLYGAPQKIRDFVG